MVHPYTPIVYQINDLPRVLEFCSDSLYADGTVIFFCYGTISQKLSENLNKNLFKAAKSLNDHKLTLNLEKTKCIIGSSR